MTLDLCEKQQLSAIEKKLKLPNVAQLLPVRRPALPRSGVADQALGTEEEQRRPDAINELVGMQVKKHIMLLLLNLGNASYLQQFVLSPMVCLRFLQLKRSFVLDLGFLGRHDMKTHI